MKVLYNALGRFSWIGPQIHGPLCRLTNHTYNKDALHRPMCAMPALPWHIAGKALVVNRDGGGGGNYPAHAGKFGAIS